MLAACLKDSKTQDSHVARCWNDKLLPSYHFVVVVFVDSAHLSGPCITSVRIVWVLPVSKLRTTQLPARFVVASDTNCSDFCVLGKIVTYKILPVTVWYDSYKLFSCCFLFVSSTKIVFNTCHPMFRTTLFHFIIKSRTGTNSCYEITYSCPLSAYLRVLLRILGKYGIVYPRFNLNGR